MSGYHWRAFVGSETDALVTVIDYETVRGRTYDEKNSRMVRIRHVPRDEAVRLLRVAS